MKALETIWLAIGNLVLPKSWTKRAWPRPPLSMAYMDLLFRQNFQPSIIEDVYSENTLLRFVRHHYE